MGFGVGFSSYSNTNSSSSEPPGAGGGSSGSRSSIAYSRTSVTSTITSSVDDMILAVSASSALDIRLPSASTFVNGASFVIKDEAGNADDYNITIKTTEPDKIEGSASIDLQSPFGAVNIYSNGIDKFFVY